MADERDLMAAKLNEGAGEGGGDGEGSDIRKADYTGARYTDAFDAPDRQGVMGPGQDPQHRAPAGEGVRAPLAQETGDLPQYSTFDGKGNEEVVVLGENEKGQPAKGSGPDAASARAAAKGEG